MKAKLETDINDPYDPVWGTESNAAIVRNAIKSVRDDIAKEIGTPPKYILDVIRYSRNDEELRPVILSERQLRIIRFCLSVALNEEVI